MTKHPLHSIKLSLKGIRAAKLFEIAKYIAVNSGALYDPSSALAFLRLYGMISCTNHMNHTAGDQSS